MQLRLLFEDIRTASWLLRAAEGDSSGRIWPWVWQSGWINLTISFLSGGAHFRKRACRAFYSDCQLDVNSEPLKKHTTIQTCKSQEQPEQGNQSRVSFRFGSERQELREATEGPASSLLGANSGYRRHLIKTDRRSQCTLVSQRNS